MIDMFGLLLHILVKRNKLITNETFIISLIDLETITINGNNRTHFHTWFSKFKGYHTVIGVDK